MLIVNFEFAFKRHSTKTYRNFCNFNRKNFRRDILDRIGLVPVMTQTFCGRTGKLNF